MHFEALLTVNYINLFIAVLMPVAMTLVLDTLIRHTPFGKLNKWVRQIIIGVLFGGLAIIGTEFGIPYENAQLNVRDASVLSAGLMFGPVSGIIAGLIGGIERWFSVFWGISSYTRIACSVSTILAGLYSAFLRQFMFDDKRPGVLISFATGLVMEVFHLNMVFLTHLDDPYTSIKIVAELTLPMVVLNSVSVMLSSLSLTIAHKRYKDRSSRVGSVSGHIQKTLLIVIGTAFIVTTLFVAQIQNSMQNDYVDRMLDVAIEET